MTSFSNLRAAGFNSSLAASSAATSSGYSVARSVPRRPASLTDQQAENIVGDTDPADHSEFAHATAWALLGVPSGDFTLETVRRIQEASRLEGADLVAATWLRSPAFTLPGALWRLYLIHQWHELNAALVEERYDTGCEVILADAEFSAPDSLEVRLAVNLPSLRETLHAIAAVFAGYANEELLVPVLDSASRLLHVLAAGVGASAAWITDPRDPLAFPVTVRPRALIRTATELERATMEAKSGRLE